MQAGPSTLTLLRCSHCSQQAWTIDGRAVDREEAFAQLSGAYREVPKAAQAARARAAADRAARLAERAAAKEIRLTDEPAADDLSTLLDGWQVLGAVR